MEDQVTGKHIEMILASMAKLNMDQQVAFMEGLKNFAVELRKPTEFEQEKIDKELALRKQKLEARIRQAKIDEDVREMKRLGCSHTMPNGRHTFRGQVNSDGLITPICTICLTEFPKIKATQDQISNGVNFEAYKQLDMATIERWSNLTLTTA